jgi:hypothetical protein
MLLFELHTCTIEIDDIYINTFLSLKRAQSIYAQQFYIYIIFAYIEIN